MLIFEFAIYEILWFHFICVISTFVGIFWIRYPIHQNYVLFVIHYWIVASWPLPVSPLITRIKFNTDMDD